ncbi:MAG: NUDIX hydrolase [Anaerolineae bacterium]|nr:NUDIX hydrolase [Anaerolineae bacterium]
MIVFDEGNVRFNYRAVGVALNAGKVLLHRAERDPFWALPGGRVELLEAASDTVRREMQEELGAEVRLERLLWVVENFFEYDGRSYHELALYFLMTFPPDSDVLARRQPFGGDEGGLYLIFQWFDLDRLGEIELYPDFLKTALGSLPASPVHVVHHDGTL